MLSQKIKSKKCPICKTEFLPVRMGQKVCGPKCSWLLVEQKKKEEYRKTTRKMKKALLDKDPAHWAVKAQKQFNKWIRLRDKNEPCISCRTHVGGMVYNYSGSGFQAGHYRPAGNHSALRFNELNCHAQCVRCNMHKSANLTMYRIHLIEKIGLDKVEWLDNHNESKRWTAEELKEIYHDYRNRNKAM
jgi:hypothetical protein